MNESSEAPRLGTEEEVRRLLLDRPQKTRTYRVTPDVLRRIQLDTAERLRLLDESEMARLAEYLEVRRSELKGDFRVVDARCPHCDQLLTFLDFVQTAVGGRHHERKDLAEILSGRHGAWITIRGRDGGRPVICSSCGQIGRITDGYSEYSNQSYAYA